MPTVHYVGFHLVFIYKNPPILHHHLNPDQCTFALSSSIFLHMPKLFLQKSFNNLG